MRKWITLLMTCLVAGSVSYANANLGQVDVEAGYRRDNISWKLRFPSNDPFLRTTHKFEDLDIFQIGINGRTTLGGNFYARANAYWGWILDGDYKRRIATAFSDDYNDGFEVGFSDRNRTTVDDKYVYGISAAIGYPFYFCDCTTVIAPVIGYAFDEQSVQFDHEGFDFGDDYYSFNNNNRCCRQTFNSKWYGPFVGVDFNYRPYGDCWNFFADLEYHWGSFKGRRSGGDGFDFYDRGNRRSDDARGWVFAAGAEYDLSNCWTIGLSVKFQDWSATRHKRVCDNYGDDYLFGCYNDDGYCADRQRTNHKWHSYAINVTVGREF
jgi:opacity protein-like surface antigen